MSEITNTFRSSHSPSFPNFPASLSLFFRLAFSPSRSFSLSRFRPKFWNETLLGVVALPASMGERSRGRAKLGERGGGHRSYRLIVTIYGYERSGE